MIYAFSKDVELVALLNKESATLAYVIFEKWICRHSCPLEIVTNQGKEFCGHLTEYRFKFLSVLHFTITAHHPQCNCQAEVANKTIAKYLTSFVDSSTVEWEDLLALLKFSFTTLFHRSVASPTTLRTSPQYSFRPSPSQTPSHRRIFPHCIGHLKKRSDEALFGPGLTHQQRKPLPNGIVHQFLPERKKKSK